MAARRDPNLTRAIAIAAARLLAAGHCTNVESACRKAAEKLGENNPRHWPDHAVIERALQEQQALFHSDRQPAALAGLRQLALDAMRDLAAFHPRLTGDVAKGLADSHSAIRLLLTAETPEEILLTLHNRHIPWRSAEVTLLFSRNRRESRPAFRFQAGNTTVELIVLTPSDRHDPPRDPADNKPLRGLSADQLAALLAAG